MFLVPVAYWPVVQIPQDPCWISGWNSPAGQTVYAVAPAGEKVPTGLGVHEVMPSDPLYFPTSQVVHSSAPAVEYLPAGQATHKWLILGYSPAAHAPQPPAPVEGCTDPAGQLVHTEFPDPAA